MDESEFREIVRSRIIPSGSFREVCDFTVLKNAQLLTAANLIAQASQATAEDAIAFRDAIDQYVALYGSVGEAIHCLKLIKQASPIFFVKLTDAMQELDSFGQRLAPARTVSVPAWGGVPEGIPAEQIVRNRERLLKFCGGMALDYRRPPAFERPRRLRRGKWGYVLALAGAIVSTTFLLAFVGLLFYGCTHSAR